MIEGRCVCNRQEHSQPPCLRISHQFVFSRSLFSRVLHETLCTSGKHIHTVNQVEEKKQKNKVHTHEASALAGACKDIQKTCI